VSNREFSLVVTIGARLSAQGAVVYSVHQSSSLYCPAHRTAFEDRGFVESINRGVMSTQNPVTNRNRNLNGAHSQPKHKPAARGWGRTMEHKAPTNPARMEAQLRYNTAIERERERDR
jgi:hypothetical protein